MDGGNTASNAISYDLFRKLGFSKEDITTDQFPLLGTAKQGEKLDVLGVAKEPLILRMGGLDIEFKTRPLVIDGLAMAFNVSGPFMRENHIDHLCSENALLIRRKKIPLFSKEEAKMGRVPRSVSQVSQSNVYVSTPTTVPPNHISFIKLRVNKFESGHMSRGTGMVSPCENFTQRTGLETVPCAITEMAEGSGLVLSSVLNPTDKAITLKKGLLFGIFEKDEETLGQIATMEVNQDNKKKVEVNRIGKVERKRRVEWLLDRFKIKEAPVLQGNSEVQQQVIELLLEYWDVFAQGDEYGKTSWEEHEIPLVPGAQPIKQKYRPLNPIMETRLREQMDNWLKQGVIEKSDSPWSFRLLAVPKKNGKTRFCVDYRALNALTIKDSYPLPNIEDNLARLARSKIFSALDGSGAYHAISIKKEDRPKTAFSTPWGLFHFCQMSFGLTGAPGRYSRLVQKLMEQVPPEWVLAYLDDTAIHTATLGEHLQALRMVLDAHRRAGLKLQPEKCQLFQAQIEYLGHRVSEDGISVMDNYKKVVMEWPVPKTVTDVKAFLGKCGYYRKFIQNFSKIAAPLSDLTKDDSDGERKGNRTVSMDAAALEAFEKLKEKLVTSPILAYPKFDSEEPFILDTDWSYEPGAIGGVLSQKQDGQERVIAYGARKLGKHERNYSSNRGELLAVIHFCTTWKYYLQGKKFILRTDHQALKWIRTMAEPRGITARWLDILANFDFDVQHRAGTKHGNADALSRVTHAREPTEKELEEETEEMAAIAYPEVVTRDHLVRAQEEDPVIGQVRTWVKSGTRPEKGELRTYGEDVRAYVAIFERLEIDSEGLLVRSGHAAEFCQGIRVCIPTDMQEVVIRECHADGGGHMGICTTQQRVASRFYFPNLYKTVELFVKACVICQMKEGKSKPQREILKTVNSGSLWAKISIDFVGPMQPSKYGNKHVLTVRETFSRWIEAFPTVDIDSEAVARILEREIFCRYGFPEQVHSDQGSQFTSDFMDELYQRLNIRNTHTPAYNPQSNPVERTHRDMKSVLKGLCAVNGED